MRLTGHVDRMEEGKSAFKIVTGEPTGRPRHKWKDNIRMGLKESWLIRLRIGTIEMPS